MNSLLNLFLGLYILSFLFQCKKDSNDCENGYSITNYNSNTIINPSDYLMTYPGSWWKYDSGVTDSCNILNPVMIRKVTCGTSCTEVVNDIYMLPYVHYNTSTPAVKTYISFDSKVYLSSGFSSTTFIKLIDSTVGVYRDVEWEEATIQNRPTKIKHKVETIEHLDSLIVNGVSYYDILHTRDYKNYYNNYAGGGPTYINDYYYAKGVGLIRYISSGYLPTQGDLISHYIAPH